MEATSAAGALRAVGNPRPFAQTVREFIFQLVTITAGILIALYIDGVVERNRQRTLVREAHSAIQREIADNRRDLEGTLPTLDQHEAHLHNALRFADDLLRRGKSNVTELHFPWVMPSLNRASWTTAERTGALSYMEYDDVKEYAELYELQDFVVDSQRQQVARLSGLIAIIYAGVGGDPHRSRPRDLEAFRTKVLEAIASVRIHKTLATQLAEGYKDAPKR